MNTFEKTIFFNTLVNKISWLGYDFARAIFPNKFSYQPYYSSYSEMVQQEEKDRKMQDKDFARRYVKVLSTGSIRLQSGNYLTEQDIEEKIAKIAEYDFKCELK